MNRGFRYAALALLIAGTSLAAAVARELSDTITAENVRMSERGIEFTLTSDEPILINRAFGVQWEYYPRSRKKPVLPEVKPGDPPSPPPSREDSLTTLISFTPISDEWGWIGPSVNYYNHYPRQTKPSGDFKIIWENLDHIFADPDLGHDYSLTIKVYVIDEAAFEKAQSLSDLMRHKREASVALLRPRLGD